MAKNNSLLLIGAAAIAYYLFTFQKAIGQLIYNINNTSIKFNGLSPVLVLTVQVSNPSNTTFSITNIVGNVTMNGNNLGSVLDFTPVIIAPSAQTSMTIDVNMSLTGDAADLISLITNETGNAITIVFTGFVTANNVQAPITLTNKISF